MRWNELRSIEDGAGCYVGGFLGGNGAMQRARMVSMMAHNFNLLNIRTTNNLKLKTKIEDVKRYLLLEFRKRKRNQNRCYSCSSSNFFQYCK